MEFRNLFKMAERILERLNGFQLVQFIEEFGNTKEHKKIWSKKDIIKIEMFEDEKQ